MAKLNQADYAFFSKLTRRSGQGRKMQVIAAFKKTADGRMSAKQLAEAVGISVKNIQSQIKYLRDDGWVIMPMTPEGYALLADPKREILFECNLPKDATPEDVKNPAK